VFVMLRQTPRTFVEQLDFRTTLGHAVSTVVTDLGVLEPRGADRELTLTAVHPGAEPDAAREATGWDLRVADDLVRTTPPTGAELTALRALTTRDDR
jgi:glutaconate CoA-transferase, subunit B